MKRTALEEFLRNKFTDYNEVGDSHIFGRDKSRISVSPDVIATYNRQADMDGKQEYNEFCIPLDSIVFVYHHTSYNYGSKKEYIEFSLTNGEDIKVFLV